MQHLLTLKLFCQPLSVLFLLLLIYSFHFPFLCGLKTCRKTIWGHCIPCDDASLFSPTGTHWHLLNLLLLSWIMQVSSAKSLLPPSRGLLALQPTWVSKTASIRFSTLFHSFSNPKLALVLHIVFLHPGGGPGQDSCTECQLAAS